MDPSQLIDQLNAAGGEIYVADPNERVRARYRRAIFAAKQHGLVPDGLQLWHTGRDRGDMVIRLLKRHPQTVTPTEAAADRGFPSTPDSLTKLTALRPAIRGERAKKQPIDLKPALVQLRVSKPLLPRCRAILQYLANEASRRGHGVLVGVEKSTLVVVASGEHLPFTLFEEQDTAPAPPAKKTPTRRFAWEQPAPTTIKVPGGRLALRLEHHYRTRTWADRVRWRLEDRLAEVVEHIDSLARAEIERQREAHEKGLRDLEAWETAAAAARIAYVASFNRRRMRSQAACSARAQSLRAFADRVGAAAEAETDGEEAARMRAWQAAITSKADQVDPLTPPTDLRWIEPDEIRSTDLAPFMPYGMSIYYRPVVPPLPA